jgi:ABC-type dipeptide/oligopeptide/nickel transport system ATPase subunit
MIELSGIECRSNRNNKAFISIDGPITFKDNTIYFIIGESGIGKSSLLNFFTSPFTEDPIKNGTIAFTDQTAGPVSYFTKKPYDTFRISYSAASHSGSYFRYIRQNLAYIPQSTASFHPFIPLARQLYEHYSWAAEEPSVEKFQELVENLGKKAGYSSVTVSDDLNVLHIEDIKKRNHIAGEDASHTLVINRDVSFLDDEHLSTGQLQRLLVLDALIRFTVIPRPVLLGDEFLVNFSFTEGNEVLKGIFDLFAGDKKQEKTAVFIFHDLSYPCIKELKNCEDVNAEILLFQKEDQENKRTPPPGVDETCKCIKITKISMKEFWDDKLDKKSLFYKFRKSYLMGSLGIDPVSSHGDRSGEELLITLENKSFSYPHKTDPVYDHLNFYIRKNRFIVLTGFSGCGKTTLCENLVKSYISNKENFRYFPSTVHDSLSFDSRISVEKDLENIYGHYNKMWDLRDEKMAPIILQHLNNAALFDEREKDNKTFKNYENYKKYLDGDIYDLSGGELQHYWFARLTLLENITNRPELLIFDESISSLDCTKKDELLKHIIGELFSRLGFTVLFITHDLRDIGVIYYTIKDMGLRDLFEYYEMLSGKIYKIMENDYQTYRDNIYNGNPVKYELVKEEICPGV